MFFSDWRVLLRRWYAVLVGLLLTVGICAAATQMVSANYQIKAMMLVLPPRTAVGTNGNPFLGLGGLGSVADVVSRSMMDGNTVRSLVRLGANDDYVVAQDVTSAGPVILITSTGSSPAEANTTLEIVKSQLPAKLLKLQQATHVPRNSLITLSPLSQDERPTIVRKSQIRAVFGVFALGISLTLVLTGLLDGAILRRARRRTSEPDGDEDGAPAVSRPLAPIAAGTTRAPTPAVPGHSTAVNSTAASADSRVPANRLPSSAVATEPDRTAPQLTPPERTGQPLPQPKAEAPPTGPMPLDHPARSYPHARAQPSGRSAANGSRAVSGPRKSNSRNAATVFDIDRLPPIFREVPAHDPRQNGGTDQPPKDGTTA